MERYPLKEIKEFENEFRRNNCIEKPNLGVINYSQMQIIRYLVDNFNRDVSQKELESVLNIRKSTISGIIDTMEKKNIIKRELSLEDGRSKIIKISNEKIKHHKEVVKKIKEIERQITYNIPEEKMATFYEVLDMMKDNLKLGGKKDD